MSDFFNRDMAAAYDERNSRLSPITDNLHFLTQLVLAGLPADARILCVGVGTGAEILSLAHAFPDWSFVGVDPSLEMLDVCRRRLDRAGLSNRARLQHGYVQDLAPDLAFDGVVSLLVAHFVQREERPGFYRAIHDHLRPGGCYLSAEISTDLNDAAFPMALEDWKKIQALMGVSDDGLARLEEGLRGALTVLPPEDTEALWRDAGFAVPVPFFQSILIRGWHARRA